MSNQSQQMIVIWWWWWKTEEKREIMKKKIDKNSMAYITNTLWWCWINFWRKKKVLTNYIWYHVKVENTVSMAFSLYIGFSFSSLGMEMEGWKTSNHRSISKLNKIIWHSCHSLQWMFFFLLFCFFYAKIIFFSSRKTDEDPWFFWTIFRNDSFVKF